MSKKAVQVMATYFGNRRHYPHNREGVQELIARQIDHHVTFDLGYSADLMIVNHDIGLDGVRSFLDQFDGMKIFNGFVKIIHRPFFEADLSFASYKYAFHYFHHYYDYWYFNEDDVIIKHPNLISDMINMLDSDPTLGYIASSNFDLQGMHQFEYDSEGYIIGTGGHLPHAHGGCGLTSTNIMIDVINKYPDFMKTANLRHEVFGEFIPQRPAGNYIEGFSEVDFSNRFIQAGYKMRCISKGDSFIRLQNNTTI